MHRFCDLGNEMGVSLSRKEAESINQIVVHTFTSSCGKPDQYYILIKYGPIPNTLRSKVNFKSLNLANALRLVLVSKIEEFLTS